MDKTARPKFEVLDGLRGFAALAVMFFHYSGQTHGYLAVDLFFVLSGVVIALAYDERLRSGMGVAAFMGARLRRLYPVYLIGLLLGLASVWLLDPASGGRMSLSAAASAVFAPAPMGLPDLFPLNVAFWSLACELLANLGYGLLGRRASNAVLAAFVLLSLAALGWRAVSADGLNEGTSLAHAWVGLARVGFSFPLGVLILRAWKAGLLPVVRLRANYLVLASVAVLLLPKFGWSGLFDLVMVTLVFPVMVALALGLKVEGRARTVFASLAALSYPLYATHVPLMLLARAPLRAAGLPLAWELLAIPAVLAGGWAVMRLEAWGRAGFPLPRKMLVDFPAAAS